MSKQPEKDPKEPRDHAKGGGCGGKMEQMMSRCAEIMPGMMAAFASGREEEEKEKTDAPAECCSKSEGPAAPTAGKE